MSSAQIPDDTRAQTQVVLHVAAVVGKGSALPNRFENSHRDTLRQRAIHAAAYLVSKSIGAIRGCIRSGRNAIEAVDNTCQ